LGCFKYFPLQDMKKTDLHILMLEDEPLDVELNKAQLALLDEYNCLIDVVSDKVSYLYALDNTSPDIILSDYNLPQYNGLDALFDLNERKILVPFIFVTGTINEETAAGTIKAGAWDYVVKDRLFRLPLAVRGALQLREEKIAAMRAEEKISRLLTAIEQTSAQIIVTDEKGIIEYINRRYSEITGLSPDDVIGKEALSFVSEEGLRENLSSISLRLSEQKNYSGEFLTTYNERNKLWELVSITPIVNSAGKITNYVAVKEDITQRKLMEQQIIEARDKAERSDRLKDAFLQNLSHEIRTPLNAIVGFSDLIRKSSDTRDEKLKEYTSIINESSHQLLNIVTDILTISIIETGQEKPTLKIIEIHKLLDQLREIFHPVAILKNLQFRVISPVDKNPLYFQTDETKLTQILSNLLNNAIKFTHTGSVELRCELREGNIYFVVKDTGIGIAKESQEIIFDRFRQAEESIHTEYGGTGLGLSISKSFADMLGGEISVHSLTGEGSEFTLSLPYKPAVNPVFDRLHSLIPDGKKMTILVAEDEITNFILLKAYLNHPNVTLIYAEDGREAINACEKNRNIDLILMDIKMPVMDGITAFEKIRKFRPDLPVIAQTAYGLQAEKFHFLEIGFSDYISKPINREELIDTIHKFIAD